MKIVSIVLTLIVINNLILCDYDLYENQISIYFKKSRNLNYNKEQSFGDEKITDLFYNNIFSPIKFGTNKNDIFLYLSFNNSHIKIISPLSNTKGKQKGIFHFPKEKKELNLNYILDNSDTSKQKNMSYLGLSLYDNEKNEFSFINQMKENKIISKRIFSILYKDKSITDDPMFDGQILFGLYPHEMTSRYNENNLQWAPIKDNTWKINFDLINFNNKENLNITEVEFDIGLNFMIGPEEYRQKIYENYFRKYIDKQICKENIFFNKIDNQFYLAYTCKYDLDIDDFPNLSLYNKILNYSIVMDFNQLICVYRGIVYFKVVFKKKAENKKWIFGRAFMELYPLVFDVDNKKIGFYKVQISRDSPLVIIFLFVTIFTVFIYSLYRGNQMMKEENKNKKEKEMKEEPKKNIENIDNEKDKLKNE